jgi:cytochrome c
MRESIFVAGLAAYRSGEREHQVMNTITARLGDEEIAALAAYFATADN